MSTPAPENKGLIFGKIISIMRDTQAITKNRKNEQQGYRFRGIDDVFNEVHPKFAEHGVFITNEIMEQKREERPSNNGRVLLYSILTIKFTFWAEDGSSVYCVTVGEGMDSGDKASNKSMSVALKYAILQMLLIPTEDAKDPENENPEPAPRPTEDKTKVSASPLKPGEWKSFLWHIKGVGKFQDGKSFYGLTLEKIYQTNAESLKYWATEWQPKPFRGQMNALDVELRRMLDQAKEELSEAEDGGVAEQAKAESNPTEPTKDELYDDILRRLELMGKTESFLLDLLKRHDRVDKGATQLVAAKKELLAHVLTNWSWVEKQAKNV